MHQLDAEPVERGDDGMTAASWYNLRFPPMPVDVKLKKRRNASLRRPGDGLPPHPRAHPWFPLRLPGSGRKRVLFGQDIHGPFSEEFGSDLAAWRRSMQRLLALEADILCEGHFGVFQPKESVAKYIRHYLEQYGE